MNLDVAHVREYLNCFTESSVEKHSLLSKQIVAVSIHLWFMAKTSEAKEQLFSKRWTAVNWVQVGNTQRNSKYCSDGVHLVWGLVKDGFCRVPAKGKKYFFSLRQCYSLNIQLGSFIYILEVPKCSFSVSFAMLNLLHRVANGVHCNLKLMPQLKLFLSDG